MEEDQQRRLSQKIGKLRQRQDEQRKELKASKSGKRGLSGSSKEDKTRKNVTDSPKHMFSGPCEKMTRSQEGSESLSETHKNLGFAKEAGRIN